MRGSPPDLICSCINQVLTTCLSSFLFSQFHVFLHIFYTILSFPLQISFHFNIFLISSLQTKSSHLLFFISTYLLFFISTYLLFFISTYLFFFISTYLLFFISTLLHLY